MEENGKAVTARRKKAPQGSVWQAFAYLAGQIILVCAFSSWIGALTMHRISSPRMGDFGRPEVRMDAPAFLTIGVLIALLFLLTCGSEWCKNQFGKSALSTLAIVPGGIFAGVMPVAMLVFGWWQKDPSQLDLMVELTLKIALYGSIAMVVLAIPSMAAVGVKSFIRQRQQSEADTIDQKIDMVCSLIDDLKQPCQVGQVTFSTGSDRFGQLISGFIDSAEKVVRLVEAYPTQAERLNEVTALIEQVEALRRYYLPLYEVDANSEGIRTAETQLLPLYLQSIRDTFEKGRHFPEAGILLILEGSQSNDPSEFSLAAD